MSKLIPGLIFLLTLGVFGQDLQELRVDETPTTASNETKSRIRYTVPVVSINTTFEEAADSIAVPHRTFSGLENVENGYYIISGAFSKERNLAKTIKKLNRKGFAEAGHITNPETGLYYAYLTYYPFGLEAVDACISKLDGAYTERADAYFNKMWYAEAADLYEVALARGTKYYTRDNLQKAAAAHYFL